MRRVLVMGCAGSGKSTFARRIATHLELPAIHLDQHFWLPGWIEQDKAVFHAKVAELAGGAKWVMDGNYSGTLPDRLSRADVVVFLDTGRLTCLWRVLWRTVTGFGKTRPDMTEGCPERFDWAFLKYVWNFPNDHRPKLLKALEGFEGGLVCLKSIHEIDAFHFKPGS